MVTSRESLLKGAIANAYNPLVEGFRNTEYPQLKQMTYLDHAGTTLYATSLIHSFSKDLCTNLYGNPHSPSPSSQQTTKRIDDIRHRVLRLFNADPEQFDIVFCANATAGMKLVLEAFTAQKDGFKYRYHVDAHTSLVGVRELAIETTCFSSDAEVELWLKEPCENSLGLFGWPAQSNFSGRRLPRDWAARLRYNQPGWYSLLDAAALVTSAPLDLSDVEAAPDFTVLSFYKMFGFPDLGALIVRKGSADILRSRRYFGGGTVDAVVSKSGNFHARKTDSIHAHLEDGTSAFHSILALDTAITTHQRLYGSFDNISRHAFSLIQAMHGLLSELKHGNGRKLCQIYSSGRYTSSTTQGPIIAFNMQRADGSWIGYAEVEKLASVKNIHIRTGGLCNPGGIETSVGLEPWEIEQNYLAGHRCWDEQDVMHGKPTGAIRISLGAMSTVDDLLVFAKFLEEFYLDRESVSLALQAPIGNPEAVVESLTIYPIKSCGGYKIPTGEYWEIRPHGFAWDREWCIVHLGTGSAIDQKRYNKMALIRPRVNLEAGFLEVHLHNSSVTPLKIPLSVTPSASCTLKSSQSRVCGDKITALTYTTPHIIDFFTSAVGVPCTLARFPAASENRHFKPHLKESSFIQEKDGRTAPILLSNESPILLINSSSVDKLNDTISCTGGKLAKPEVFRGNIVIRETTVAERAYAEDFWKHVKIGQEYFQLLGPCRRCHMVCVDQETAEKNEEPYVTLAKTRRIDGRVLFGQHAVHLPLESRSGVPRIKVGDVVRVWQDGEEKEEKDEGLLARLAGVA
ncbi:PLP-dependent transferase [Choiromyces venosus 120613-1]|uniref:Molybdenum cofactor sulfurase n=1 Tax=Choiromyces venosus 120613-1 TaxID=1336337 RepID=A0A3N4JEC3_9PEZI|nr:PLP-dependent transferase [Choiromyces venosus 120613-1]